MDNRNLPLSYFHLRRFPDDEPRLAADLGLGRYQRKGFTCLFSKAWVPNSLSTGDEFEFDPITRARAYHLVNPSAVAGQLTALAFHGLRYFTDKQPTLFHSSTTKKSLDQGKPWLKVSRRHKTCIEIPVLHTDPQFPELAVASPGFAVAGCLSSLERGTAEVSTKDWWVPEIPGLSSTEIRQIQLVDAVRRITSFELDDGKGLCSKGLLHRILRKSDDGSDSPPETLMRLMVEQAAPSISEDLIYVSQVRVFLDGRLRTTLDGLLLPRRFGKMLRNSKGIELKSEFWQRFQQWFLGLQYDGVHHLQRGQRDSDAYIDHDLLVNGMRVIRVTSPMLRDFEELSEGLRLHWVR